MSRQQRDTERRPGPTSIESDRVHRLEHDIKKQRRSNET
jgi:hypothetical protein